MRGKQPRGMLRDPEMAVRFAEDLDAAVAEVFFRARRGQLRMFQDFHLKARTRIWS